MILARGIRGEQWPASFESPSYTGNNLPDSLSMNEWPSAARPRKAMHLNNKGPGGHPLLYYCKFIAAFFVWLPLQADASKCPVDWEASKQRKLFRKGARITERYMEKIRWILFLCSTIESAPKKHSFLLLCDWSNAEPQFEDLSTWIKLNLKYVRYFNDEHEI